MDNTSRLNATMFAGSFEFVNSQICALLKCLVDIYNEIIHKNCQLESKEESIRDAFFSFLDNDEYRNQINVLQYFHFEREPKEQTGYVDIKVKTISPYMSTKAYYVFECKKLGKNNLKGKTGLNSEYVKNGICRFVEGYYSSYFGTNAMLGFVIEPVSIPTDIVDNINSKLNCNFKNSQGETVNARATQLMEYRDFADHYDYSYTSRHTSKKGADLLLYHLMFDLSNNVK